MLHFCLASDNNIYNLHDCGDYESAVQAAEDILEDPEIERVWIVTASDAIDWVVTILKHIDAPAMGYVVDKLTMESNNV